MWRRAPPRADATLRRHARREVRRIDRNESAPGIAPGGRSSSFSEENYFIIQL